MSGRVGVDVDGEVVDPPQRQTSDLGRFGGVLDDVAGDLGQVDLTTRGVDVPQVQTLVPPGDPPAPVTIVRVRSGGIRGFLKGAAYRVGEHGPGNAARGCDDRLRAIGVVAVETDQGVVVDDPPDLKLVDLDVAATQVNTVDAAETADFPID